MSVSFPLLAAGGYWLYQGARNIAQKSTKTGIVQVIGGLASTTIGAMYFRQGHSCDPRIVLAGNVAVLGATIAWSGAKDVAKGHYGRGALKLVGGIGAVAGMGYSIYKEFIEARISAPPFIETFVQTHQDELKSISECRETGQWKRANQGAEYSVYTHPEIPQHLVKISPRDDWTSTSIHNIQYANQILAEKTYRHLVIPETFPFRLQNGKNILIQQLLPLGGQPDWNSIAYKEFVDFLKVGEFCDVALGRGIHHNADFIRVPPGEEAKIGIYDLDCCVK